MKVKIDILTPLHIGSGEEISPSEYLIDKESNKFYRINMSALFQDPLFQKHMDRFLSEASKQRYIGSIFQPTLLKKYPLYSIQINGQAKSYLASNQTNVKAIIKTAGQVFIPGSSIKGSILSALVWHVLKDNYSTNKIKINELITSRPKSRKEELEIYNELLRMCLSYISPTSINGRFSQWISISDSDLKPPQESIEIYLSRVKGARRGGELPILFEGIKKGIIFESEIIRTYSKFSEKEILEIVHNFYKKVAEYDGVKVESKPYLIRLGQGSTAYAASLLILANELGIRNYKVRHPKTRKRINDIVPIGFARISEQ